MAPRASRRRPPEFLSGLGAGVVDALPISLYVVDRQLRVVGWNRMREQGPIGKPRERTLGRPLRGILTPEGFRAAEPVIRRVFRTGQAHQQTTETRDRKRLLQVGRYPVILGGKVTHVVSHFEDVTERRALEMQMIASDRLAFLGQQVAGVAHELSNPLAGIAGCAEALASLAEAAPGRKERREAKEFRDLIRSEVARCERIVRSLLDAARPRSGSSADVREAVGTVLRLLERHPAFARVKVLSRLPPALARGGIEPDSLRQVVIALATNAARAMAGGGTLTLRAGSGNGQVHLDVLDTGPGVPPEIRARIFEPFFTTDSTRGTGLGLAIARSLVRSRGGDLLYRPRMGGGAHFRVVLQAAPRA